jgi:RNA polymerase sigma-70 factor (ECF subfamily)
MDKKDLLKKAESLDGKPNFLYSTYKNPSDIVEEKEKNNFVRQCLQKVSPTFRMVVILKDIEGLSYEEISKLLKCSLGTVKSRLSRGREELKKILFKLKDEVNEYEM